MPITSQKLYFRGWPVATVFGLAVFAGSALAVQTLHTRAVKAERGSIGEPAIALTGQLTVDDGYVIRESFAGRVEPARQTLAAAERAGLIEEILVEEGSQVAQGQMLARLDAKPLQIERTRLAAERAGLDAEIELARRTAARRAKLAGEGWASGQINDEAQFSLAALKARRDALDAAIALVELDIEKSVVTAPYAGRIAARLADEGAVVNAGTAIVQLQETSRPQARIGVPPDRAAALRVSQVLELEYLGQQLQGRVVAVSRDMDHATRTVAVLVDLPTDTQLAMGQVVRLQMEQRVPGRGAWVRLTALSDAGNGLWSVLTVVEKEGAQIISREAAEVLHVENGRAFVRGTFAGGALYVRSGAHKFSNGQAVTTAAGS